MVYFAFLPLCSCLYYCLSLTFKLLHVEYKDFYTRLMIGSHVT